MPLCIVVGAGPGMGAAIAGRFGREGFDLALIARDGARLEALAADLARSGIAASAHAVDICDKNALGRAFEAIAQAKGPAHVLVYNAARWHERPAMDLDPEDFAWDLSLCVTGALISTQCVYPAMRDAGSGTILFTGGGLALNPQYGRGVASLTAGKSALRGLTFAMAGELAEAGIHVATVTIAGTVDPTSPTLAPDRIAEHYWMLHRQERDRWSTEVVVSG